MNRIDATEHDAAGIMPDAAVRPDPVGARTVSPVTGNRVVVLGQGYVGLPISMLAASAGFDVVGYDPDEQRVSRLRRRCSYVEDVSDADLAAVVDAGCFRPSSDVADLAGFDIALITVPTPMCGNSPDLTFVAAACRDLAPRLRPGCLVVLESTTYPGTTEEVVVPILETSGLQAGCDFHVGYSPERVNPGNGIDALRAVPKVVSGIDTTSCEAVRAFWARLVDTVVPASNTRTAEFVKVFENTFRLVNVSLVNELAEHAPALGVDIREAVELAATKPYGFMAFWPSVGAGGHCLPVDPHYLDWQTHQKTGARLQFVELAARVNNQRPAYVARRIMAGLAARGHVPLQARILAVGITYKPGIADIRESRALAVVNELRRIGVDVQVHDPLVTGPPVTVPALTPQLMAEVSVVAILVHHAMLDIATITSCASYVFDACGATGGGAHVELL